MAIAAAPAGLIGVIEAVRHDFHAVAAQTYLDIASCAPLSQRLQRAVAHHLSDPEYGFDKAAGLALVEQTRSLFAQLINADADDIALTKNVSEGLNGVANAIDWKSGDNVVVCPALEHPNNRYLWHHLAHRLGVQLRLVPAVGNEYPIAAMLAAIDARTRLVTLSTVSYLPGLLTPLGLLSALCRRRDILLLVDAAQSVGPLHTDVRAMGADALAVTTQKGLLGVHGMGFLYVRPEWAQRLRPVGLARFGVDEDMVAGKGLVDEPLTLRRGTRRFDMGNYNLEGAVAVRESLLLLLSVGTRTIEVHTVGLARRLAEGLAEWGLPVCRPRDEKNQAHVVSLGSLNPASSAAQSDYLYQFYRYLTNQQVRASWRNGIVRFSVHLYNNTTDIQKVLDLAQQFVAKPPVGLAAQI